MSPAERARAASAARATVERGELEIGGHPAHGYMKLTPTQRLHEVTMAAMTRPVAPPESSVSFTRNAKGVTQIEITVRAPAAIDAYDVARGIYEDARARYPLPSGYVGAEGEPQGGAK